MFSLNDTQADLSFLEKIWAAISGFFDMIGTNVNDFLINMLNTDQRLIGLYNEYIVPMSEVVKVLLIAGVAILIVVGAISVIKRSFKLIVIIAIVLVVLYIVTGGASGQ